MRRVRMFFAFVLCATTILSCVDKKGNGESVIKIDASVIKMGDISEKTENPFREGFEHDFMQKELVELTNILKNDSIDKASKRLEMDDILYIANFYTESGEEVLSLAIDKKGNIYTEDGNCLKSEKLDNFFKKIIGN